MLSDDSRQAGKPRRSAVNPLTALSASEEEFQASKLNWDKNLNMEVLISVPV